MILERGGAVDLKRIEMPATHHSVEGAAVFLCSLYCQTTCLSSAKHPANHWFSNSYLLLLSTVGCQKKVDPSQVCSVLGGGNPGVTRCCLFGTLSKLTLTPSFQILRSSDTRNIRSYDIFKLTWNEQVTKWKVKRHSQGCWSAHVMWSLIFVRVATQNVEFKVILAVVLLHRQKGRCLSDF